MATNSFSAYLRTEEGKEDAKRFADALKEGRLLAKVAHVSQSGMSRVIMLYEIVENTHYDATSTHSQKYHIWNFVAFARLAGFPMSNNYDGNIVKGCGMDMVFHMVDSIAHSIKYETEGEIDCTPYTSNYSRI